MAFVGLFAGHAGTGLPSQPLWLEEGANPCDMRYTTPRPGGAPHGVPFPSACIQHFRRSQPRFNQFTALPARPLAGYEASLVEAAAEMTMGARAVAVCAAVCLLPAGLRMRRIAPTVHRALLALFARRPPSAVYSTSALPHVPHVLHMPGTSRPHLQLTLPCLILPAFS